MKMKMFKVIARSSNSNSFGLFNHILIAQDGAAFQICRSRGAWLPEWPKGTDVPVPISELGVLDFSSLAGELSRRLPKAPRAVVQEVWGK